MTGELRPPVVPVLLYHAVTIDPGRHIAPFTVTPDQFQRHMDVVRGSGLSPMRFGDLAGGGLPSGAPAARAPVVITFDDGYADFADEALPVLQERSLPATLFLTTGWLSGGPPREPGPTDAMLSWSQVRELAATGVELGAHSHSHPQLDTLSPAALRHELVQPRELLEDHLGAPVELLAYPHGYNGPRVRRAARSAGYRAAAAVRNALHRPGEDSFNVSRLMVTATTSADDIAGWLNGQGVATASSRESFATRGWRLYRRGCAIVRRAPGSDYR